MRLLLAALLASTLVAADWPAFRGSNRDGVYSGPILKDWPKAGLPQVWRIKIGDGYAGVSIAAGKVFTIEQRGGEEAVAAYALADGKQLWVSSWKSNFKSFLGGNGPRSTPTIDDGLVYVQGAQGEFRCLDAGTGKVIWAKNVLAENRAEEIRYGQAMSPLVFDDKVIVLAGGKGGKSIVAYNKKTGAVMWSALDDEQGYSSPVLVTLAGIPQILDFAAKRLVAVSPKDGSLLWSQEWSTQYDINSAQPVVVGPDKVLISSGYGHGAGLIEVSKGASGGLSAKMLWTNKNLKNKFNSSVYFDGFVYGLDEGILTCLDVSSGARKWKEGRFGYGQVLLAGGHLIVTAESGEVVLIKADPGGLKELAKFQALNGKTWNTPAMADGQLVVRNESEMACYKVAP